jgi:outer membrane protein assembly factor BamB
VSLWGTFCLPIGTLAADWPQWLGPRRDSVWREEGIIDRIPDEGLKVNWRVPVGWGYAGPAVAGGRVYLIDYVHQSGEVTNNPGRRDPLEGTERIVAFDAQTGEIRWKHQYERPYNISFGKGPRCTPTVADGKVYALGAEGDLRCLEAESGELLWSKSFPEEYGAETPIWGHSAHPLVYGNLLYCVVGGEGSVAVAFNKDTGAEVWRALSAKGPGYCPPTIVEHDGASQLVIWHEEAINGLDPESGKLLWTTPLKPAYGMAISTPRQAGRRLFATAIRDAAALIDLSTGEPVWRATPKTAVICSISTPFLDGGIIYGNDASGTLTAARLEDGERLWQTARPTMGPDADRPRGASNATLFLVKNGDRFFLFNDSGDLIVARLSPEGYEELGRFHVLEPTNRSGPRPVVWSHPAFAQRCMFARNDEQLVCVSLAGN